MALIHRIIARQSLCAINGYVGRSGSAYLSTTSGHAKHKRKAEVIELKGKPWLLFASPAEVSLVCAVSTDFEMHRGIAREFKKVFGNVHELQEQKKDIGEVAVLKRNDNSFVYHLLVKSRWWDQGTPEAFHSAISAMKQHCVDNSITELAIPRLGTGDDGIEWQVVKGIIEEVFHDTDITIKAYSTR